MPLEQWLRAHEYTASDDMVAVKAGDLCEGSVTGGSLEEPSVFTPWLFLDLDTASQSG